ncbi:MAG TPA: response regulator [Steroidobacter sp.]|nr:response regulator [Steroidobacter sp.]
MSTLKGIFIGGRAHQPSLIAMLAGSLLVVPILIFEMTAEPATSYLPLPLALTAITILGLLAGRWVALGAVALTVIDAALFGGSWLESGQLLSAVLAAELLRRGVRPVIVTAFLLLTTLGSNSLGLDGQLPDLAALTTSLIQVSAAVATAVLVMLVMPRRSPYFPTRCRIQWDLVLFALVVGMASIAAFSLASNTPQSARLFGLMLLAHLVAFTVARRFRAVARDQDGKLRQWLFQNTHRESRPYNRMPTDITAQLLALARETRRLKRLADRDEREVVAARQTLERQNRELQACQRTVRDTSAVLSRISQAHETTQARWGAVVEQSSDVMLVSDRHGRIEYANRAVVRLLGVEPEQLIGTSIEALIPTSHMLSHPFNLIGADDVQRDRTVQAPVRCVGGKSRELAIRISEFAVGDNIEYAIHLRTADGTKHALTALKRAQVAVNSARRTRNSFNAAMSHELRTPLHGLIATLDMLRDESLSSAGAQRLAIAKASARSLLKIANDILDLSRMDGGEFTFERRSFSLTHLLQEAVEEARAQANSRGLQLSTNLIGSFPPSLLGDGQRIRQIVVNLISNAMKFTHQGGVRVAAQFDGKECTIDVIDSGEGIPKDKRDLIFEPFVQAHESAKHLGAGLGLSICRRLSVAMGGSLMLLSSSPAGSTFRLTLPLDVSDEPAPEETSLRIFNNPRGRILVVEDHPVNQYVVKSMLDVLKCPATLAGSGKEALQLIAQEDFDLILMDCQMPGMDGFETTRELRKLLTRPVPIIAMTANAMLEDRNRCLEAGMDDFLPKPFGRGVLNDILCKWLAPQKSRKDGNGTQPLRESLQKLPAIDPEVFDDLWSNLKWQLAPMRRIGETFLSSVRETEAMFDQPSGSTMRRQIHTLLGTAGMIGARQIERIAAEMQTAVKARRWDDVVAMHAPLQKAAWELEQEFDRRLNNPPGLRPLSLDASEL